ncbi:MAG: histidine phosphatase family protein [Gaiellaceae bacterium]
MRHAEVGYFGEGGRPLRPEDVSLTATGERQARAAAEALEGVRFDRVVTSGLPRTLETAALVAPGLEPESWPELRELESGRLADIPDDELENAFVGVFDGVVPDATPFLGGETIGSLLDRVLPALDRLVADDGWNTALAVLHGAVNRAILSHALTGERTFLGNFEQAPACINVLDLGPGWIVRAVNVTPYDPAHLGGRSTTMERLLEQYLPYRKETR